MGCTVKAIAFGVVLYGACTQTGMYEVSFADSTHVVGSQ
jgi:hypothetical protein